MWELVAIGQGFNALKSATEAVKSLMGMRGDARVLEEAIKLNKEILAAQAALTQAQTEQTVLTDAIRNLEKENAGLKEWDSDKKRYDLTRFDPGVFTYALRPDAANGQPIHELCPRCYDNGEKSILQATTEVRMRRRVRFCPTCKNEYAYGPEAPREEPRQALMDYDPFHSG